MNLIDNDDCHIYNLVYYYRTLFHTPDVAIFPVILWATAQSIQLAFQLCIPVLVQRRQCITLLDVHVQHVEKLDLDSVHVTHDGETNNWHLNCTQCFSESSSKSCNYHF